MPITFRAPEIWSPTPEYQEISTAAELLAFLNKFPDWRKIPGKVSKKLKAVEATYTPVIVLEMRDGGKFYYTEEIGQRAGKRLGDNN